VLRYFLTRLAGAIPTLFIIVTIAFFLIRAAPGGPFDQEQTLSPEIMANLQRAYGLDQPVWKQYDTISAHWRTAISALIQVQGLFSNGADRPGISVTLELGRLPWRWP